MKSMLKYLVVVPAVLLIGTTTAFAATAQSTAALNLRSGPGTGNRVIAAIPSETRVSVEGCTRGRKWCKVSYDGHTGWASGAYLARDVHGKRVPLPEVEADVAIPLINTNAPETTGAVGGAVAGAVVGGPFGAVVGALIGANTVRAVNHTHND